MEIGILKFENASIIMFLAKLVMIITEGLLLLLVESESHHQE